MKAIRETAGRILDRLGHSKDIGWEISTPFIYRIGLNSTSKTQGPNTKDCMSGPSPLEILSKILPYSDQIFIEGDELLEDPEIFGILDFLDERNVTYHLQTKALWVDAPLILRKLQRLRNLNTLRIIFPVSSEKNGSPLPEDRNRSEFLIKNLRMAVGSGLNVWTVTPLIHDTFEKANEIVIGTKKLGVKGNSFTRETATTHVNPDVLRTRIGDLHQLYESGYPVVLEDCLPLETGYAFMPRCKGGIGSCFVDAFGNIRVCRHDTLVLGNVMEHEIDQIWMSPPLRRWRLSMKRYSPQVLETIYQHCCPFMYETWESELGFNRWKEQASDMLIEAHEAEPDPVALHPDLFAVPLFRFRSEKRGAVLIKGHDFLHLSERATRIVSAMNGDRTLQFFRRKFGQEALSLIYALFCFNLVRLERKLH
jgi:MoaA/NifB/PqqE/SkfB family radical SAM enzyme